MFDLQPPDLPSHSYVYTLAAPIRCWTFLRKAVDVDCLSLVCAFIVLLCEVHDHKVVPVFSHFVGRLVLQPRECLLTNPSVAPIDSPVQTSDATLAHHERKLLTMTLGLSRGDEGLVEQPYPF